MSFSMREVVQQTSDATLKGKVLARLAAGNQGFNDTAILDITVGDPVDGETFSLGSNVFEFNDVSTAETATGSAAGAGAASALGSSTDAGAASATGSAAGAGASSALGSSTGAGASSAAGAGAASPPNKVSGKITAQLKAGYSPIVIS